jgi:hypothetical protein
MTTWSTPLLRISFISESRSAAADELNERIASPNNERRRPSSDAPKEAAVEAWSTGGSGKEFAVGVLVSGVFAGGTE